MSHRREVSLRAPLATSNTIGNFVCPWQFRTPLATSCVLGNFVHHCQLRLGNFVHPWQLRVPLALSYTLGSFVHHWQLRVPLATLYTIANFVHPWQLRTPMATSCTLSCGVSHRTLGQLILRARVLVSNIFSCSLLALLLCRTYRFNRCLLQLPCTLRFLHSVGQFSID